jgi:hypothetical protein
VRFAFRVFAHSGLTCAELHPSPSYTIGGTIWHVSLRWEYDHHSGVSSASQYPLHADLLFQRDWTHRKVRSTAAASGTLPRPLPAAMHASSSSRPYAATRTSLAITGPEPQTIRCRPAHDVRVLFAYDELLVRGTLAFPSSFIRWHLLIPVLDCVCAFANIASLLLVHDQGYAPSAHPCLPRPLTPEQIALRRLSPS